MTNLTPKEIVNELNRFVVGQNDAKKSVAIALRNRWRRLQLDPILQDEVVPKNILMVGPTGVGKTEIAKRLAKLAKAPFIKVEATKFTEVGYVGRDVEQMIRDLLSVAIQMVQNSSIDEVKEKASENAKKRIINLFVGESASNETYQKFLEKLINDELNEKEIEIEVSENNNSALSTMDIPGMPGSQIGMLSLSEIFGKNFSGKTKLKKVTVKDAIEIFTKEESEKLIDQDQIIRQAIENVQQNGIVFIDEIDKICTKDRKSGGDVSREGVQRDLLPLIEGTNVSTKYGNIKTEHILFITSGSFHLSKPSDLLPELQGRLPIRVELKPLSKEDFIKILKEPEANLIIQYSELLKTEGISIIFEDEAIEKLAELAENINNTVENIGARRLHTILEKLLEDISFDAPDLDNKNITITAKNVEDKISVLIKDKDLSKFIL